MHVRRAQDVANHFYLRQDMSRRDGCNKARTAPADLIDHANTSPAIPLSEQVFGLYLNSLTYADDVRQTLLLHGVPGCRDCQHTEGSKRLQYLFAAGQDPQPGVTICKIKARLIFFVTRTRPHKSEQECGAGAFGLLNLNSVNNDDSRP